MRGASSSSCTPPTRVLAEQALRYIQLLYEIEIETRDLEPDLRRQIRQEKAMLVMEMLHAWMIAQRDLVPEGSAISRALDYSLKRWAALSRYLDDGAVPIDNNWCESQIRLGLARTGSSQGRYAAENGQRRS